jgi:sugar/nucleoside kinase (ribokinase family)
MTYDRLEPEEDEAFCQKLEKLLPQYDVAIVADYGHGLMTDRAINLLCTKAKFLAVNAQTNAGNRGFNMISRYPRADFISIDEPEARLETRDPKADVRTLIKTIAAKTHCGRLLVTMGRKGTLCYDANMDAYFEIPAFAAKVVDRIGAGDAVLALAAPCATLNLPLDVVGFVGNVAGAEACGIMGNKSALDVASFLRHISSLLK